MKRTLLAALTGLVIVAGSAQVASAYPHHDHHPHCSWQYHHHHKVRVCH